MILGLLRRSFRVHMASWKRRGEFQLISHAHLRQQGFPKCGEKFEVNEVTNVKIYFFQICFLPAIFVPTLIRSSNESNN